MDRRQYLGLTGASIVALLGGCSSSGSQSTATTTDTATATETATATATETATATATETPTEEPTETATSTPEPQNLNFQSIYDDAMADARAPSVSDEVLNSVDTDDWSARDLEKVAVSAAQNARKEHSAQNIAKALYNAFSTDADELYADSRRVSLGGGRDIVKVFDQKNDGILYLVPWASQTGEDDALREGEDPNTNTERNLAGLQDPTDLANGPFIDPETNRNAVEYSKEERNATEAQIRGLWESWMEGYDDLLPGAKYDTEDLTFTEEAARYVAQQEVHGYGGIDHIKTVAETMEATDVGDDETVKFYKEGGDLSSEIITGYNPEQGYAES